VDVNCVRECEVRRGRKQGVCVGEGEGGYNSALQNQGGTRVIGWTHVCHDVTSPAGGVHHHQSSTDRAARVCHPACVTQ
jgi:hypothetical protein